MYENMHFAPRKDATRVTDMNEALAYIQDTGLTVTPHTTLLGRLSINDDGSITNGEQRLITEYGFENLCKLLGIPNPFARKIPVDLLFTNIRRLQNEKAGVPIELLERPDGTVATVVKSPYKEASYGDLLAFFDGSPFKYIDVGERWLTLAITFEETPIHYDEQDTLYVGTFVHGSITRDIPLHMESGLYRTQCENSFLMPYFGKVRANYKLEAQERLLAFRDNVRCYDGQILDQIRRGFPIFQTRKMWRREVVQVWRKLSNLVGQADADRLLSLDQETRTAVIEAEHAESVENRIARLQGKAVSDPVLSDLSYYDVLNAMTFQAKGMHEKSKLDVERLAGRIIQDVVLN